MRRVAGKLKLLLSKDRIAAWIALLLGLNATGIAFWEQHQDNLRVACQTQVNKEFLDTLKERARIGQEGTANIEQLIQEVFSTKDPKQAMADYQIYLTEAGRINGEISKATYPDFNGC